MNEGVWQRPLLSPEWTWKSHLRVIICSFSEQRNLGEILQVLGGRLRRNAKTNVFFAQQVSKLWISLPQDVTDLKWLKLIEYINGRKNPQGLLNTKMPSLVQASPELQSQKAGNYIKRMSLHYCLFLYSSQSREYLLLPETGSSASWTLNLIQCICSCDLILISRKRKKGGHFSMQDF